ncbi:MAG: hypothetical protein KJ042_02255 [Deltaproteobacteria bacterium]|nr:hypothetical protein [Deltaproteobacteria bacterium]
MISVSHLTQQRDRILGAKTREQLKDAAAWPQPLNPTTPLPANVGVPPYHYRCRTTLMAVVKR